MKLRISDLSEQLQSEKQSVKQKGDKISDLSEQLQSEKQSVTKLKALMEADSDKNEAAMNSLKQTN